LNKYSNESRQAENYILPPAFRDKQTFYCLDTHTDSVRTMSVKINKQGTYLTSDNLDYRFFEKNFELKLKRKNYK